MLESVWGLNGKVVRGNLEIYTISSLGYTFSRLILVIIWVQWSCNRQRLKTKEFQHASDPLIFSLDI